MQSQPESLNTSLNHIHSAAQTRFTQPLSPSPSPSPSQNYVPFLIKSNRFHHPRTQPAVPPIGSYDLPSCFDRKKSPFEDRASHFLLEAVRKKQQMCIFKSSLTRFNNISSPVPGPASYNLFRKDSQHRPPKPKIQQQRENLVELLRSCPSIPHKGNKYGYAVVNGNMRNIEKTEEQLEKERESRRHYVSTLQGEPSCAHHDTLHRNYHDADYRKRLYEETQKVVNKQASYTEEERDPVQRKPKYEHLYHSKGVPVENSHKLLGPGQYDIARNVFSPSSRKEKYQFFGSTEVRFKERTNQEEKGYTLIEMIKENNRKSTGDMLRDRKTPLKKKLHVPVKEEAKKLSNPGPGDYNPQDEVSKRTRGTAFFPQEERFKEKSAEQPVEMCDEELLKLSRTQSKKMPSSGNLKKDRFKPIHKAYDPVKSEQICGILSEKGEDCEKENQKGSRKREARARAENQEISCWSRGERREKARAGGYIKELKEELAIINYTPGPEEIIKKHSSNKYTLQSECTD